MATATLPTLLDEGPRVSRISRVWSVDVLRGLVMVIMALDHTRDFFSNATFDPTDLNHTTPLLFFTRWITHFCAPVFVLLAGSGAYFSQAGGRSKREVAKFLVSRGLWLVFLEFFVISPFGWSFSLSFGFTRLQVIWAIGVSMIVLGGAILVLSSRVIGCIGVAMIMLHNLSDGGQAAWLGASAAVWKVLHQITFVQPLPHKVIASLYPLVPWVGVMMTGYALGEVLSFAPARRQKMLLGIGAAMSIGFVVLRATNLYGDPGVWSVRASPVYTLMSFLRCNKYPPSLLYLLMTLGPALVLLALIERTANPVVNVLQTFGRVPLFYYLLHLPLLHATAILFSWVRYGSATWLYQDLMGLRGSAHPLPVEYGYGLPVVYAVWLGCVAMLYPACRWYSKIKQQRGEMIFRYL